MIKVICSITREGGPLYYDCTGHADYQDPVTGNNDLCVAISTINLLITRYLDVMHEIHPTRFKDGAVTFDIESSNTRINEVFRAAMLEISFIAERYPEQVKVY